MTDSSRPTGDKPAATKPEPALAKPTAKVPSAADLAPSAREVARHLDRRQRRRKIILLCLLIATIILAIVYLRCGRGWGLGGKGPGDGEGGGTGSAKGLLAMVDAGTKPCELLLAPEGITIDGAKVTREQAVTACKAAGNANAIVTGNVVQADWDELKAALDAAGIKVQKNEPAVAPTIDAAPAPGSGSAAPGSGSAPAGSGSG